MNTKVSNVSGTLMSPIARLMAASSKKRSLLYRSHSVISSIEDRFFHMKAQVVIEEFMQILLFIRELEKSGMESSSSIERIYTILIKVKFMRWQQNERHESIIRILSKYLVGVKNFISSTGFQGVLFYKELFESVFTVVIWELDSLESDDY